MPVLEARARAFPAFISAGIAKAGDAASAGITSGRKEYMSRHRASRVVAAMLISLLPVCAYPAGAEPGTGNPAVAVDEMDLKAVGQRIRQTGAQMQADLRKARARLEANKVQQAAARKREAEAARQQAIKDQARRAAIRERQQRETAQKQAEPARQAALAAHHTKQEKAAKQRAAQALKEALKSEGEKAFADEE